MNETQRNIKALKAALPELREKVAAVALLLLMSAAMMTSATFAWITLSRAPEVSNVSTTVAANGNLEIALVKTDGSEPAESAIGDSSAAEGQTIVNSNITWGNLVNLSDESYGLSNIVLRPALLGNANNLLKQPLKGVDYGTDGRLEQYYNEDYQFTSWFIAPDGTGSFRFYDDPKYGVRAISTVEYQYTNSMYKGFADLMTVANQMQQAVYDGYAGANGVTNNKGYLDALAAMIGTFMTDNLNDSDTDISAYIKDLYNMLMDVYYLLVGDPENPDAKCFEDALVAMANTMVYTKYATEENPEAYLAHTYTWETLYEAYTKGTLAANGVKLDCLDDYIKLRDGLYDVIYGTNDTTEDCIYDFYVRVYSYKTDDGKVDDTRDSGAVLKMSELKPYINKMVHIDTCKLLLRDGRSYQVNQIGMKVATQIMSDLDPCDAQIQNGLLVDFEVLTGANMCAQNVKVKASYSVFSITARAETITTTARQKCSNGLSLFEADAAYSEELASANKSYNASAQDTYGMALDFWVRTNTAGGYLVLEGNVLTEEVQENETGIDKNGNLVNLYTVTVTTTVTSDATDASGNAETSQMTNEAAVYKLTEDGKEVWYYADSHAYLYDYDEDFNATVPEGQTISTPKQKIKITYPVIGYEGENRIWQDAELMNITNSSTSQGNGSCYVFYADDPGQQANCLRLLSNLRVAFIDNNPTSATSGKLLAIGKLDTDNRYEESGKVTLPLVLYNDGSDYLTKTENGLAIMNLPQNEAVRLTAVVYLDGREISNADVLAASDIQGQLNIQFGSTAMMEAISDEKLELATRSVTAVVKKSGADSYPEQNNGPQYDDDGNLTSNPDVKFSFDSGEALTVNVKVKIDGDRASKVEAFFMRKVSDTQGSRESTFTLYETESGVYEGSYTFIAPGEYVLRTVQLDGVDYSLPAGDYPRVAISGFTIQKARLLYNGSEVNGTANVMTGARSVSADLELQFASSNSRLPNSVKMQLEKDDGTLIVTSLTYNSMDQVWRGSVSFSSSGLYTLKYVILDGEYTLLSTQPALDLTLGMKVRVTDGGDYRSGTYEGTTVNVPMFVEIYDNNGDEVKYRTDAKLFYLRNGSVVQSELLDLKWSASGDNYTCTLPIQKAGKYTFSSVVVGNNTLTETVNTPPTFNWMSPTPPSYHDAQPMDVLDDYILDDGTGTIQVGVRLLDAEGASVAPILYNSEAEGSNRITTGAYVTSSKDETVTVNGETKTASTFYFDLPITNANGNYRSGDWEIIGLKLYDVYTVNGENSTEHTPTNPLIWQLSDTEVIDGAVKIDNKGHDFHVKVVNLVVTLLAGGDENLDGGVFMGTATAENAIKIRISDQNGDEFDSSRVTISDLSLKYMYVPLSSQTYGHYLGSNDAYVSNVSTNKYTVSGAEYTFEKLAFSYAGMFQGYELVFNLTIVDTPTQEMKYTSPERKDTYSGENGVLDLPVYTLSTDAPTVTINSVSTNAASDRYYPSATPGAAEYAAMFTGSFNNRVDDHNAVVYMYFKDKSNYDAEAVEIKYPSVTLGLSGIPTNHSGVTMVFPNDANSSYNSTFTFAAGATTATTSIGAGVNGTYDYGYYIGGYGITKYPVLYPAGKQTVSQITVTYNNATYTVDLSNSVTINNPQYPPHADFKVNDSTFTGTVPGRIYATPQADGTFVITLPGSQTWITDESSSVDGQFAVAGTPTERTVHTKTRNGGNFITGYKYDFVRYTERKTMYQAQSSTTTWKNTRTITGWKVNGKT